MKFLWLIVIFLHKISFSNDGTCKQSVALLSNLGAEQTQMLFDFKKNNNGTWKHSQASYVLEPQNTVTYSLSWQVKQRGKLHSDFADGVLRCEIPETWQVTSKNNLGIVFPPAAHGKNEETPFRSQTTFAGIYLGKSIYQGIPDTIRIMWHLDRLYSPKEIMAQIKSTYSFINSYSLNSTNIKLDKNNEVQLIALQFSQSRNIDQGEQHWFIANEEELSAIEKEYYQTPQSSHNTWLPWLDINRPEFKAISLLELYESTVVAPFGITKIYNRTTHSYILEQGSITNKMQMVYDIIAPLVRARRENTLPLFTHLLLKSKTGFELFGFEILENGVFDPILDEEISDPSLLGLPSAQELGFSVQE